MDLLREMQIATCIGLASMVFVIGATYILPRVWVTPLLHVLLVYWCLAAVYIVFRVWTFETLNEPRDAEPQTFEEYCAMLGYKPKGMSYENTSDWEDIDDTTNSSETFGIDTPSETGKSSSSSTSISTDSDTSSDSDDTISSLGSAIQPFPQQETPRYYKGPRARLEAAIRRRKTAKPTNTAATMIQQPEPLKSKDQTPIETLTVKLKQPPRENLPGRSHIAKSKIASGHQSPPISYLYEKAKQQPADVIVLYVVKGIEDEERMLVRMHKTTPFVFLKNKLRDKDDIISELAIKEPEGGEFPVFDYDTPLSVSFLLQQMVPRSERSES
ncbi:hypothetical protein KCU76_g12413, partial [Aureobasidium melanogenum]